MAWKPSDLATAPAALALLLVPTVSLAQPLPACRLDASSQGLVADTIKRAAAAYKDLGKALPFESVLVNPQAPPHRKALAVYIIKDATQGDLTSQGCPRGPARKGQPLDALSVRGGCVTTAIGSTEVRCSASAVALFGNVGSKPGRANPALLYVLSHELAHVYQRRLGEYAGRTAKIELSQSREVKLKALQDSCDPVSTKHEAEADSLAVKVLERLLSQAPYREPLFSEQGSLFWNVDQLALASDAWRQMLSEREFKSQPSVHKSFVPTQFPTPKATVEKNARTFICDVLTTNKGSLFHPLKSTTHPSLEERLRRIAEALRLVAQALPNDTNRTQFESVARLQSQLSPAFNLVYRETGAYMEAIQSAICTSVNAPTLPTCK